MISLTDQTLSESAIGTMSAADALLKPPGVIDLCSGLGGLSSAAADLGMRAVAAVDTDSAATKTYQKNFPTATVFEGSVRSTKIIKSCREISDLLTKAGKPLILVSGPPCQGFSMAGSRDPKDPRNKVLVSVARAIVQLRPKAALVENVSMVLSDKYKSRVNKFVQTLEEGGYYVTRVLLDASDFGVPQRRKRTFFLITKREFEKDFILEKLEKYKSPQITVYEALAGMPTPLTRPDKYNDEEDYGELPNHLAMQHSAKVKAKIAAIPQGKGPMSYRKLHPDRPSNTLFSGHRAPPAHFSEPRSITVREAARLQGFADSFRIFGSFGKQMGQVTNAVPPPLARAVLRVLADLSNIPISANGRI